MPEQTKPDVSEQYTNAIGASNLRVEADRRTAADIIIAAGWSKSRLGASLLRLHSEWDSAEHPLRPTAAVIESLVGTLQRLPAGVKPDLDANGLEKPLTLARARECAYAWYRHEVSILLGKLKTMPEVRYQMGLIAQKWSGDTLENLPALVLQWWLDRGCHSCHMTKFEVIPGTGRQSAKLCRTCRGTGQSSIPCGEDGRRMANYMDDCINHARTQILGRLHEMRPTTAQQSK